MGTPVCTVPSSFSTADLESLVITILALPDTRPKTLPKRRLLLLLHLLPIQRPFNLNRIRPVSLERRVPRVLGGSLENIRPFPGRYPC